ncbi:MAG: hypothetical protein ACJ74W_21435 [Pyrinomonadaceae bacterium]
MEQILSVIMALVAFAHTLAPLKPACPHAAGPEMNCSWTRAVPPGQGDWPRWLVPVVALDGKLWMVGHHSVWSSTDGVRWRQTPHDAAWGERYGATYAFFHDQLWTLGGMDKSWDNFKHDVWATHDGTHWTRMTARAAWSERRGHSTLVFGGKLWVLGGAESSGRADQTPSRMLNDVWSSTDGINWTQVTDSAPWRGELNSVVWQDRMWVFNGDGAWHSTDGRNWVSVAARADWPARHGNNFVVFNDRVWMFGGLGYNDVWATSDGIRWQQVAAHAPWTARGTEYSIAFNGKLWLYGGKTGGDYINADDVWFMQRGE